MASTRKASATSATALLSFNCSALSTQSTQDSQGDSSPLASTRKTSATSATAVLFFSFCALSNLLRRTHGGPGLWSQKRRCKHAGRHCLGCRSDCTPVCLIRFVWHAACHAVWHAACILPCCLVAYCHVACLYIAMLLVQRCWVDQNGARALNVIRIVLCGKTIFEHLGTQAGAAWAVVRAAHLSV